MRNTLGKIALGLLLVGCGSSDPGSGAATGGTQGTTHGSGGTATSTGGQANPGTGGQTNTGVGGQTSTGTGGSHNPGAGGHSNPATGGQSNPGTGGQPNPGTGGQPATQGDGGVPVVVGDGPYLPWAVGNSWTYQVTTMGVTSTKITTVGALEMVGGQGPNSNLMANHVITSKMDGTDKSESWQGVEGDLVVRYDEQSFSASTGMLSSDTYWDPHKIHFDNSAAHTALNATWTENYQETVLAVGMPPLSSAKADQWTVVATDAMVTVPAGTFTTIQLQKVSAAAVMKTYYFARGVGKVKEEGTTTEELVSYQIVP